MTRIYIFADDSMEGRNSPLESNARGNAYIVRELTRLGLRPAGDLGTYLQTLPYVTRAVSPKSSLRTTDGAALGYGFDFVSTSRGNVRIIDNAQVIYGGVLGDTSKMIPAELAANKFVIVSPAALSTDNAGGAGAGGRGAGGGGGGGGGGRGGAGNPNTSATVARYAGAVGSATISPNVGPPAGSDATTGIVAGNTTVRGGVGGRGAQPPMLNDPRAARVAATYLVSPAG